ncbi:MAG: hypothetical protein IJD49_10230 [Clostridia bacterium]|nr:hypothetical protein [Clostridia bacterium]
MRKLMSIILTVCILLFAVSCSTAKQGDCFDLTSESNSGEYNFISEWPDNEFTHYVPKPEYGKVWYTYSFNNREAFSISLEQISEEESNLYIEKLKSFGYVIFGKASNDVSTGINMVKDNIYLSIAYSDGVLGMMIIKEIASTTYCIQ